MEDTSQYYNKTSSWFKQVFLQLVFHTIFQGPGTNKRHQGAEVASKNQCRVCLLCSHTCRRNAESSSTKTAPVDGVK